MKKRQIEIIKLLRSHLILSVDELLCLFDISIRTLYYDIEIINYVISEHGVLLIRDNELTYEGDKYFFSTEFEESMIGNYVEIEDRRKKMLASIMLNENKSLDDYSEMFQVGKTTVFNDINYLKSELRSRNIFLYYDGKNRRYCVEGDECSLRWLYLEMIPYFKFDFSNISPTTRQFNMVNNLQLSDYSLFYLDNFVSFINKRVIKNKTIDKFLKGYDTQTRKNFSSLDLLIKSDNIYEKEFISTYIISLSGQTGVSFNEEINSQVKEYTYSLLFCLKTHFALYLENWDQELMKDLYSHLLASYYRIFFGFPAYNPSLTDIRIKYYSLYNNVKYVVRSMDEFEVFVRMREEEIGFLTAYIGGFIAKNRESSKNHKKIVIVCPQGRAFSNHLSIQIQNLYPNVTIVGSCSVDSIDSYQGEYDKIVSTIDLPNKYDYIKVNGFLNDIDKNKLSSILADDKSTILEKIIDTVKQTCIVKDEKKLIEDINNILLNESFSRRQPMLKELLSEDRIIVKKEVEDWKEAVYFASKSLVKSGSITEEYVQEMINNIEKYGPYVVIADEFALPHASGTEYVHELSMSMLILKEPVDMKGKKVRIFTVLATVDNESHLKALSSLSDMLSVEDNLKIFKSGNKDKILHLIKEKGGE